MAAEEEAMAHLGLPMGLPSHPMDPRSHPMAHPNLHMEPLLLHLVMVLPLVGMAAAAAAVVDLDQAMVLRHLPLVTVLLLVVTEAAEVAV